jgi:hypothetical protein
MIKAVALRRVKPEALIKLLLLLSLHSGRVQVEVMMAHLLPQENLLRVMAVVLVHSAGFEVVVT